MDWSCEPGSRLEILGDGALFEQILGNLLKNSLQAFECSTAAVKTVRWTLGETQNGRPWIQVEDNGPGIPPEIRSKLFTPFVTTRPKGTGLGLSFIKQALEEQGGTIQILPRPAGQGACFLITLALMKGSVGRKESARRIDEAEFAARG